MSAGRDQTRKSISAVIYTILDLLSLTSIVVPKSETRGFDSWLTSSLRIEFNFPLATSDIEMMSETKFYSYATNEQNKYGVIKYISVYINRCGKYFSLTRYFVQVLNGTLSADFLFLFLRSYEQKHDNGT